MKTKPIISLCSKSHRMELCQDADRGAQWLSDGHALYLLGGLPDLTTDILCSMYDISEKNKDKIVFRDESELPEHINFDDIEEYNLTACPLDISLKYGGDILIPLKTELGLFFVNNEYLKPFSDSQFEELSFFLRYSPERGFHYIAVKRGLLLEGLILPIELKDDFVNKLGDIWSLSSVALKNIKELEEKRPKIVPVSGNVDIEKET